MAMQGGRACLRRGLSLGLFVLTVFGLLIGAVASKWLKVPERSRCPPPWVECLWGLMPDGHVPVLELRPENLLWPVGFCQAKSAEEIVAGSCI